LVDSYDDAARGNDGDDVATTAGAAAIEVETGDEDSNPFDCDVDIDGDVADEDDDDDDVAAGMSIERGDAVRAVRGDDASTIVTLSDHHPERTKKNAATRLKSTIKINGNERNRSRSIGALRSLSGDARIDSSAVASAAGDIDISCCAVADDDDDIDDGIADAAARLSTLCVGCAVFVVVVADEPFRIPLENALFVLVRLEPVQGVARYRRANNVAKRIE
jgi:hypothetical protein